ncbi:MAG: hypothetical protein M3Q44_04955 [bacterium]|nr:hypothetical protein [bacterium]
MYTNWPQTIFVTFVRRDVDYIIIHSIFNKSQIVERSLLQNNCQSVIKNLYQYFQIKKIDILPNIQSATYLQDPLSAHEKPLPAWKIAIGLFVVTPIIIYIMYRIALVG